MSVSLGRLFCCRKIWPNHKKIQKVFNESSERIEEEMNILYIINKMREVNVLIKYFKKDPVIGIEFSKD
jgi:hypothetical protein